MTRGIFLAGYDVEYGVWGDPEISVKSVNVIAKVHKDHDMPATFFICGKVLEARESDFRDILNSFDVQSHTYSHINLKTEPLRKVKEEIIRTNKLISSIFGRTVKGLRSPGGFHRGLQGERGILRIIWESGIRFVSSDLYGEDGTMPAPFNQPYWYCDDGFIDLLEIPSQGWHDNLLKAYHYLDRNKRVTTKVIWPPATPWPLPERPPKTPQEEFAIHKHYLDYASERDLIYSPIIHPWSTYFFNPKAETIDLILEYTERINMAVMNYHDLYEKLKRERS
ncbi:MAG: polysaccharide deacetylase family protein [Candidatus Bathyarchaeia archaeon]